MTLEQQTTQSETYSLTKVNGVPVVVAETALGSGTPQDGDGLVGTVIHSLFPRDRRIAKQQIRDLEARGYAAEATSLQVMVSIPTWRVHDAYDERANPATEASYAAEAIGRTSAADAIINWCLQSSGAPKRVTTGVLDDNTSRIRLWAVLHGPFDDIAQPPTPDDDTEHQPDRRTRLLTVGFIYAAHRALRLIQSHPQELLPRDRD
jgi:hypothetical protein